MAITEEKPGSLNVGEEMTGELMQLGKGVGRAN